jgi:predicted class III extradiol MEMO1 family dioxygenase
MQWKAAISPHDDYKYAGRLYYESLKGINANTIILMVLHIARNFYPSRQNHFGDLHIGNRLMVI